MAMSCSLLSSLYFPLIENRYNYKWRSRMLSNLAGELPEIPGLELENINS